MERLRDSIVVVQSPDSDHQGQPSFAIDSQLLWDILTYDRAGREDAAADQTIFGSTLNMGTKARELDARLAAEFDLVGSAGISGHKAVSKETPAYAPNEDVPTPNVMRSVSSSIAEAPLLGTSVEDRFFEGMGGVENLVGENDHVFLQAHDFGKAIDGWLGMYSPN